MCAVCSEGLEGYQVSKCKGHYDYGKYGFVFYTLNTKMPHLKLDTSTWIQWDMIWAEIDMCIFEDRDIYDISWELNGEDLDVSTQEIDFVLDTFSIELVCTFYTIEDGERVEHTLSLSKELEEEEVVEEEIKVEEEIETETVETETDTTPPEITLIGDSTINLFVWDTYTELWATATDAGNTTAENEALTDDIVIDASAVDTSTVWTYEVTYIVYDTAENQSVVVTRDVVVKEKPVEEVNEAPVINETTFAWTWVKTKNFPNVVSDDGLLNKITMTASPKEWTLVYNWDGSITYTRTDWNSWTTDSFNVTFSDWNKTTTNKMNFQNFDDE